MVQNDRSTEPAISVRRGEGEWYSYLELRSSANIMQSTNKVGARPPEKTFQKRKVRSSGSFCKYVLLFYWYGREGNPNHDRG